MLHMEDEIGMSNGIKIILIIPIWKPHNYEAKYTKMNWLFIGGLW